MILVIRMSDLFHELVDEAFIASMWPISTSEPARDGLASEGRALAVQGGRAPGNRTFLCGRFPSVTKLRSVAMITGLALAMVLAACVWEIGGRRICTDVDPLRCQQAANVALEDGIHVPVTDLSGVVRVAPTAFSECGSDVTPVFDVTFELHTAQRPIVVTLGEVDDGRLVPCTY